MTFLNFSQLLESVFRPNFPGKHLPEIKLNFSSSQKCFLLIIFLMLIKYRKVWNIIFQKVNFRKNHSLRIAWSFFLLNEVTVFWLTTLKNERGRAAGSVVWRRVWWRHKRNKRWIYRMPNALFFFFQLKKWNY